MAATADVTGLNRPQPLRADLRIRDERLDSLGLLAGSIAHDFNNLLAPILGYSTLIKEEFPPESSGLQYAQSMETAARRAEKNIEQTLLATRPQRRFNPRPLAFDQLVISEVEKWQSELPSNSAITVELNCSPATLTADDYHWRIVVRHLLNNARYGCATGGLIKIALTKTELTANVAADLGLSELSNLCLIITDNGSGLSPEGIFRAFDPFYTTRAKGATLGLGLTACHSVTYLHGGQIGLVSAPDRGTQVTIWLPCNFLVNQAVPSLEATKRSPTGAAPVPRKRVLLLADDLLEREVLKTAFIKAGYETMTPEDRPGAKRVFDRLNRELAFVLVSFTSNSDEELLWLRQMQEVSSQIPFFLLCAEATEKLDLAAQKISAQVLPKPFRLSQLLALIPKSG